METYFRYVPLKDIESFKAKGWVVVDNMQDTHHGRHAVLMKATDNTIVEKEEKEKVKAIGDLELYVGDLMGEVIETINRCGEEGYLTKQHAMMLTELAIELSEQWEEDLEQDRRAKNDG